MDIFFIPNQGATAPTPPYYPQTIPGGPIVATTIFMEGLLLQASLIFALGAQNVFILESGLRRQNHISASFVCFFCDFLLIMLGVAGAATFFNSHPNLKILVGLLGVIFLFQYGISKLFGPVDTTESKDVLGTDKSLRRSVLLAITFSILNPHAYLDAFILIGGFSTKYAELSDRVMLGMGAAIYSLIWFLVLSSASSVMKPILSEPRRMRAIMSVAGLCLVVLSAKLGLDVMGWMLEGRGQEIAVAVVRELQYPRSPGIVFTTILY